MKRYGRRLKGTKYDFQVPNPGYPELNNRVYTFIDDNDIHYYLADKDHWFVVRQREAGVTGTVFWTLRPIVYGAGRRSTPFPRLGQTLSLFGRDGRIYSARVVQDYRLPRHATGWVILSNINEK